MGHPLIQALGDIMVLCCHAFHRATASCGDAPHAMRGQVLLLHLTAYSQPRSLHSASVSVGIAASPHAQFTALNSNSRKPNPAFELERSKAGFVSCSSAIVRSPSTQRHRRVFIDWDGMMNIHAAVLSVISIEFSDQTSPSADDAMSIWIGRSRSPPRYRALSVFAQRSQS